MVSKVKIWFSTLEFKISATPLCTRITPKVRPSFCNSAGIAIWSVILELFNSVISPITWLFAETRTEKSKYCCTAKVLSELLVWAVKSSVIFSASAAGTWLFSNLSDFKLIVTWSPLANASSMFCCNSVLISASEFPEIMSFNSVSGVTPTCTSSTGTEGSMTGTSTTGFWTATTFTGITVLSFLAKQICSPPTTVAAESTQDVPAGAWTADKAVPASVCTVSILNAKLSLPPPFTVLIKLPSLSYANTVTLEVFQLFSELKAPNL